MSGTNDDPIGAAEKRWRRLSLYSLIVLLPLVIAVSGYDVIETWWTGKDRFAQEVAVDGSTDFGGAQWRLSKFRMLPIPAGGDIPEGAMALLAEFDVQIHDTNLSENWMGCALSLEGPDGRRWAETDALRLPSSEARPCISAIFMPDLKAGATVRVQGVFLAPRDVADSLRVTVSMQPQRPQYLRFMQPPLRVSVK